MMLSGTSARGLTMMVRLPLIRVLAADAREIRTRALRAPLERVIVHALGRKTVVAVALDLVAQCADHLAVTAVTAFAHVDVPAGLLERRVGPHALHLLDRAVDPEQRRDLHQAADRDDHQDADQQDQRILLKDFVFHGRPLTRPVAGDGAAQPRHAADQPDRLASIAADRAPDIIGHDQRADDEQQAADGADHVVGLHRLDGFDERVLQETELVVGAPHQPCVIPDTHIAVM